MELFSFVGQFATKYVFGDIGRGALQMPTCPLSLVASTLRGGGEEPISETPPPPP